MNTAIDHLVLVAADLDQGTAWAERTLGVTPVAGGKHPLMGTHNRLVALDDSESYLEIIAIDPDAPPPGRARWFGMDELGEAVREAPRLVSFVARTHNLDMHRWGLVAAGFQPGTSFAAHRETANGVLRWRMAVPDDGRPLAGGAIPALIQWEGVHPSAALPRSGVTLERLTVRGLPAAAADVLRLRPIDLQPLPGPALQARLQTPLGSVILESP
jgi:catechol 2,3-dioxygenase-like lactoylglutathione lyase family enzyme